VEFLTAPGLRKVLNATGIILHTGLGRAVFASKTRDRLMEIAQGYCNLEIDLESGKRGDRQERVAGLLSVLTGGEAACVVNNNAAAVMLVLNTLADRKEVIVSRGELIEIGGSFRLPEIIKKSGARLVEVGTTNKTRASDYAKAITPKTAALMKVHTSNYRIQGFTEDTGLAELSKIGRAHQLPVVHDLGGGILLELKNFGLPDEPVVEASIQAGANLITFSGDKIIGGPQAGLIVGDATLVQRVKRNPFMRALRCDKLTLSLLETALQLFLKPSEIQERHPVLRMLSEPIESVKQRALEMASKLREMRDFEIVVEKSTAEAGSGALPVEALPSYAVGIRSEKCSDIALAARLRRTEPPVIAYTRNRWLWLDVRTIHPLEIDKLVEVIATLQEAESG
jgi:L-seryl-tRNA(Ser) seleniumtransferase